MKAETEAWLRHDYDALSACWVQGPEARRLESWAETGTMIFRGWEAVGAMLKASFPKFEATEFDATVHWDNLAINVGADMAWATYEQVGGPPELDTPLAGTQNELKIFHKIDGSWKIACIAVLARRSEIYDEPLIEVGRDMSVLRINAAARAALEPHGGLVVGAGRLKAQKRGRDAELKEAVTWAHGNIGAYPSTSESDWMRPVSLGEDDLGRPVFCWVLVEDGKVLVAFSKAGAPARLLERAAEVYGLSPAQAALAARLIAGQDLNEAAGALGVSVNTARTQLSRMFDKTGARNQAALVRTLLSLHVPTKD